MELKTKSATKTCKSTRCLSLNSNFLDLPTLDFSLKTPISCKRLQCPIPNKKRADVLPEDKIDGTCLAFVVGYLSRLIDFFEIRSFSEATATLRSVNYYVLNSSSDRGVVSHFDKMTYVLRHNHSKYPSTVLYRFKTAPTVLAVLRLLLETFTKTEVTAFFKC